MEPTDNKEKQPSKHVHDNSYRLIQIILAVVFFIALGFRFYNKFITPNRVSADPLFFDEYIISESDLSQYSTLNTSQNPQLADSLAKIWDKIRDPDFDPIQKISFLSDSYTSTIRGQFYAALYLHEDELGALAFPQKLQILQKRQLLKEAFSPTELKETPEKDIMAEIFYIILSLIDLEGGLEKIKFESDTLAYGLYTEFIVKKSVTFIKEKDMWKIDPLREDPDFLKYRNELVEKRIRTFGSEEAYLTSLLEDYYSLKEPLRMLEDNREYSN